MSASSNPTVAQVAKIAGVSKATASAALRDSPKVAQPTKDRVVAVARQLGYRANLGAAGLRAGSHPTVAVLLSPDHVARPLSVGYFFHGWVGSFVRTASEAGLSVNFVASHDVSDLSGISAEAVVLFGPPAQVAAAGQLGFGLPVVHVSTGHHHDSGASVVLCHPNEQVVTEVMEHLTGAGVRGPAFVIGREELDMANEVRIFLEFCRNRNLSGSVIDAVAHSEEPDLAAVLAREITGNIDGIYSRLVNPETIAEAALLAGRTIGGDLLLVCDGNRQYVSVPPVALSCVDFLGVESGRAAAETVISILAKPEQQDPGQRIVDMPHNFTIRRSSEGPVQT